MQLILDTVPVLREEDRQDLLQVTPQLLPDLQSGHLNQKLFAILFRHPQQDSFQYFIVILSQVMPSYISHGWKVKRPFCEMLPDVDSQGETMARRLAKQGF